MLKVLVIDDDRFLLELVRKILERESFDVVTLQDPVEFMRVILENRPDVIITDLIMPEKPGGEILESIRRHPETRDIPVIVLSSATGPRHRIEYLRSGAADYLEKPFEPEELVVRIQRLTRQREEWLDGLVGGVETYSLTELVQNLAQDRKSGRLTFFSPNGRGSMVFQNGRLLDAHYAERSHQEAFWSMLEEREGRFQFKASSVRPLDGSQALDVGKLLLEAVWVEDELAARKKRTPGPDYLLELSGRPLKPQDEVKSLPVEDVFAFIRANEGKCTVKLCTASLPHSKNRMMLCIVWLMENGIISIHENPIQSKPLQGEKSRRS